MFRNMKRIRKEIVINEDGKSIELNVKVNKKLENNGIKQ